MHAYLFDIDGTLLSTGRAGEAAMLDALRAEFRESRPIHGIPTAGRTDRAILVDLLSFCEIPANEQNLTRLRNSYLRHLPEELKRRQGELLPGVPGLLAALSERSDVMLGLLTGNLREGAKFKLGHYGLHDYFGFGGFGDLHVDRNDVAHAALAEVRTRCEGDVNLDRVWVIGDTPADVRAGRAIGAKVIAVATGIFTYEQLEEHEPDHLFRDFSDHRPLLELLE